MREWSFNDKDKSLTNGRVVGIDPSEGMIKEAVEKSKGLDIVYEIKSAEDMDYKESFDVIFCNSAFKWFKDPEKAIKNCYRALRKDGRIGIQAPVKKIYCPNFLEAIEMVKRDYRTKRYLLTLRNRGSFLKLQKNISLYLKNVVLKSCFQKLK